MAKITGYPFPEGFNRPMLWIRASNPAKRTLYFEVLANVDTGTDVCIFPLDCASKLGLKPRKRSLQNVNTAKGPAVAYIHDVRIEILGIRYNGFASSQILWTISKMPVYFVVGGPRPLMGANSFLEQFVLTVNYPQRYFSIESP